MHASSSLEQGINEIYFNTFENVSATHTMDGRIHSSSDQSETNAFPSEIGSSNVEEFSLKGDTAAFTEKEKGSMGHREKIQI